MARDPSEGDIVDGRFRLKLRVDRGSGPVAEFVADDLRRGLPVTLKLVRDPEKSWLSQARALATLGSEHVLRLLDVGEAEAPNIYLVSELLPGERLRERLDREPGPVAVEDALRWILEACAGLAEAHAHGRVHRELTPQTLFLERRPDGGERLKVCDFGLATPSVTTGSTQPQVPLTGTPHYLAPEQIE